MQPLSGLVLDFSLNHIRVDRQEPKRISVASSKTSRLSSPWRASKEVGGGSWPFCIVVPYVDPLRGRRGALVRFFVAFRKSCYETHIRFAGLPLGFHKSRPERGGENPSQLFYGSAHSFTYCSCSSLHGSPRRPVTGSFGSCCGFHVQPSALLHLRLSLIPS